MENSTDISPPNYPLSTNSENAGDNSHASCTAPAAPHGGLCPEDPFSLIDFSDPSPQAAQHGLSPSKAPQVSDTVNCPVQPALNSNLPELMQSKREPIKPTARFDSQKQPTSKHSLLPSRSRGIKSHGSRRTNTTADAAVAQRNDFSHNRSSTPESIASEIRRAQQMPDPFPSDLDPYTQWYQMMEQYYKQFFPHYDASNTNSRGVPGRGLRASQNPPQRQQAGPQAGWIMPPGAQKPPPDPSSADYAALYYQYYYGAAAAFAQSWLQAGDESLSAGRHTPKIFIEPHIRATLQSPGLLIQVLPNRPQDNEPGRVEFLDIGQLATDVVAEATTRLAEVSISSAVEQHQLTDSGRGSRTTPAEGSFGLSLSASREDTSDAQSYSLQNTEGDEEEEDVKECTAIITGWDRTDHALYPGPLTLSSTLKSDVLAFLRGKLEDIQDRMPVDWDSAGLLLSYLELLVKNNGVVHPGDVVSLLLENQSSHHYEYPLSCAPTVGVGSGQRMHKRVSSDAFFHYPSHHSPAELTSLPPSEPTSGRESPSLRHSASSGYFQQQQQQQQHHSRRSNAGSSVSGASVSRLLRKAAAAAATIGAPGISTEDRELVAVTRFRELLMHGHLVKALEHACQQQLWGHAFALAQRLGPGMLSKVMDRFLGKAVRPTDPLLTFYQLTAGQLPQSVDQLAYVTGVDNGDWRPHLAMLLSAPEAQISLARDAIERMGESLFARRLVYAAHFCFLLLNAFHGPSPSASPSTAATLLSNRIWLLGVIRPNESDAEGDTQPPAEAAAGGGALKQLNFAEQASNEAFQLTEVYEFTLALASRERRFFLPQLLPIKFVYCMRLIDAGLIEKAFRYLEVLSHSLVAAFQGDSGIDQACLFVMVSRCLQFAQRLQYHPGIESFESAMDGGRFGLGSADPRATRQFPWIDRLREVYDRLCGELGLPTEQRPLVDPPAEQQQPDTADQRSTPVPQYYQQQQPPITDPHGTPLGPPHAPDPRYQTYAASSHAPAGPTNDQSHSQRQQWPTPHQPERAMSNYQHPDTSQPTTGTASQAQNLQPAPPGVTGSTAQNNITASGNSDAPIQPYRQYQQSQQQYHNPASDDATTSSQSVVPAATSCVVPPVQQQHPPPQLPSEAPDFGQHSVAGRTMLFQPSSQPQDTTATEPVQYDYFAHYSSQVTARSRNISASSHGSVAAEDLSGRTSNGGVSPEPLTTSGSPISNTQTVRDSPQHQPVYADRGPEKEDSKPAKAGKVDDSDDPSAASSAVPPRANSKSGWLPSILGRFRRGGGQEVHLPDDTNRSIIWDDETKRWIDLNNPEPEELPPPPPILPNSTSVDVPVVPATTANEPPRVPMGAPSATRSVRSPTGRPRYVNVLANQTSGSAAQKVGVNHLAPPLPPVMSSS